MNTTVGGPSGQRRVGIVTIGQTPRPDLLQPFVQAAESRSQSSPDWVMPKFVQGGALDQLSRSEIEALAPQPGEPFYVTKLADKMMVKLAVNKLERELQRAINEQMNAVDLIVIACTGTFPGLQLSDRPHAPIVIEPDSLLKGAVAGVNPRRLAIVVPEEPQRVPLSAAWRHIIGDDVVSAVLSPYCDGSDYPNETMVTNLQALVAEKPDLIVFDCMAYDEALLWPVMSQLTTTPLMFSAATVARIVISMA